MPQPVFVDNKSRRSDNDALFGDWVDVVSGPSSGRYGVLEKGATFSGADGYPVTVVIRTRDARNELLTLNYSDLRPSRSGKR